MTRRTLSPLLSTVVRPGKSRRLSAVQKTGSRSRTFTLIGMLVFFIATFVLVSCYKADDVRPVLDSTPELFGSPGFGVVNQSYVRAYASPDAESSMVAFFRGGDIVTVSDRAQEQVRYMNEWNYWYQIKFDEKTAWVFGSYLELCTRELSAKKVSEQLKAKLFGS